MVRRAIPPAGIGLLAGLLTTAVLVVVCPIAHLPFWASAPLLLLGGGVAAGIAAPVRPPTGALLGAATGLFAAALLASLEPLYAVSAFGQPFATQPLKFFSLVMIASVPLYTLSGAFGAAARWKTAGPAADGEPRGTTSDRRAVAGIALGALFVVGLWASTTRVVPGWRLWIDAGFVVALLILYAFTSGFIAALFSRGGLTGALRSSLIVSACVIGILTVLLVFNEWIFTRRLITAGLIPTAILVIMIYGIAGVPPAVVGGIIGGNLMKPFASPPALRDRGDGEQEAPDTGRQCDGE